MSLFGNKEDKKAIADAYVALMKMPAWKDLENYAKAETESSVKRQDDKPAGDLTIGFVCEERGVRKGISKLIQYAQQKTEGI